MRKFVSTAALAVLVATPALADSAFPDLRGVWKGTSDSIVSGTGNSHHETAPGPGIKETNIPFTLRIDMQDGRRFSGTFSSPRASESIIGVISRTGAIYFIDSDGYSHARLLAPNQLESCYLQIAAYGRVASCIDFVKEP